MGLEAECRVESSAGVGAARVLLETDSVIVRGAVRETIPFKAITGVAVLGEKLVLTHGGARSTLFLGPLAQRWAEKILNPRSRIEKLGVKPGLKVSVVRVTDPDFKEELLDSGAAVTWGRLKKGSDIVFLGVATEADFTRVAAARDALDPNGALWVIHPKGKDGVKDTAVFAAGKRLGLVANKVAKFSETHTGERLVIPQARRAKT